MPDTQSRSGLVRPTLRHRLQPRAPDLPPSRARADEPKPDTAQTVAADTAAVDTERDPLYGYVVLRGHSQTSSTPHRRAGVELSASADPEGWVNHSRPEARRGHAATAVSVAPTGSSVEAWGRRLAAKREPVGGIPGSAPAGQDDAEHLRQSRLSRWQAQR
jgi:hypothetical protein